MIEETGLLLQYSARRQGRHLAADGPLQTIALLAIVLLAPISMDGNLQHTPEKIIAIFGELRTCDVGENLSKTVAQVFDG